MKQGHWLTIDKAFKGYRRNLVALKSYPYPYVSGVDYSKPRVTGDGYKNGTEQMVMSAIDKKDDLEKQVRLVEEVVREVNNTLEQEVTSTYVGELVMRGLKELDEVAYVRFASVYRQFKDINTFMEELKLLLNDKCE